ncbi:transcription initiation factor TFIID subunit 7-like [Contarinia nasturtii]|uniref:transcription initiation factor TFIID subunit 7-like n=1 Tax=Contarinia nasturtii TaxID=265458 RepID=UPI0012D39224|nr:transcription initiation factor TFIID subunit 7-like [Contarinia nasturtii]
MPDKQSKLIERDDGVELETQVVLRMPMEPAQILRETLREGGPNLKDRLKVKLEHDLRYGEVRFDHWLMYTKLVDLPTVTESLKTIDSKNFYKTADVCQMLICKYEHYDKDAPTTDDESPAKNKKKDSNKVDKKFLWPHGVTPPCKNVRKRRFRKTLRKKCAEAPEIEKEVKRLLRADNEAVQVKWDIVLEEEDPNKQNMMLGNDENTQSTVAMDGASTSELDKHLKTDTEKTIEDSLDVIPRDIDIFGEDLSSSDDEDNNINVDVDETTRLSADDSRSNFSSSMPSSSMATEFNKQMFNRSPSRLRQTSDSMDLPNSPSATTSRQYFDDHTETDDNEFNIPQMSQNEIQSKISDLRRQLDDLRDQRIAKEQEISSIENETLRARMQDALDNILGQILDKEMELQEYQSY